MDILEVIKHTFDVEGVSFVLITNKQQLKASINHCYGHSVDANNYLEKFLKFTIKLPDTHTENGYDYLDNSVSHYQKLIKQSPNLRKTELDKEGSMAIITHIITLHRISLREIETLIRHLEVYQVLTEGHGLAANLNFGQKLLRLIGVVMFSFRPDLANALDNETLDAISFGSFLGVKGVKRLDGRHPEDHEFLAVVIGQECSINSEQYTPDTNSEDKWRQLIREYFDRKISIAKGGRSKIIQSALKILNLRQ